MPAIEGQHVNPILGRDCVVEKIMKFLKEMTYLMKNQALQIANKISMTLAVSYSDK